MIILLLIVLLAPSFAWANSETLYVRPAGSCANNGNGTAYSCAASNGAVGAYIGLTNILYNAANTVGQVDPGDKLYVCGTYTAEQMEIYQDGTTLLPIEIDFGCHGDTGWINPTSQNFALYIEASNIKVHGGTVSRGNLGTLLNPTNGGVTTDFSGNEIYQMTVNNCLNATTECIGFYGTDIYIHDNVISDGANDGIHGYGGKRARISNNTISRVSTGGSSGDCIQIGIDADGTTVSNNSCNHTNTDSKYCIFVDSETVAGQSVVTGNTCIRNVTDTVGSGIRANNAALIFSNIVTGGQYGIQCAVPAAKVCSVIGNIIKNPNQVGVITANASTLDLVMNNTIVGGNGTTTICITLGNPVSAVQARNNICSGQLTGISKLTSSGATDSHNLFFNISGNNLLVNGTPTSAGTGSVTGDPLFISEKLQNYKLKVGSPARRAGIAYGGDCRDARGRVCNIPPDIGAYQMTSGDPAGSRTTATTRSAASRSVIGTARSTR